MSPFRGRGAAPGPLVEFSRSVGSFSVITATFMHEHGVPVGGHGVNSIYGSRQRHMARFPKSHLKRSGPSDAAGLLQFAYSHDPINTAMGKPTRLRTGTDNKAVRSSQQWWSVFGHRHVEFLGLSCRRARFPSKRSNRRLAGARPKRQTAHEGLQERDHPDEEEQHSPTDRG